MKALAVLLLLASPAAAQSTYTAQQAERGAGIYQATCSTCHGADVGGDGNGITPALFGPNFMGNWGGLPLSALLDRIKLEAAQAPDSPGLSRAQQIELLAFLLQKNEIAPSATAPDADALAATRLSTLPQVNRGSAGDALPPAFPRPNATTLFDTDRITVWNIVWPAGQPTPMHRHRYDQVGTYYAPGGRKITTPDGQSRTTTTEPGSLSNTRAGTTHIEEGTTDPPLRAVFIELKRVPDPAASGSSGALTFERGTARQVMNDERVTAWDYTPVGQTVLPFRALRDTVIVWLGSGKTQYLHRGESATVDVAGSRALVFEIK
jgi:hypothetical protein